jgi:signal transduction histidine kinase
MTIPLFPYPHLTRGERSDGILRAQPEECLRCRDRPCASDQSIGVLSTCRYGLNYLRLRPDLLVFGIVVRTMEVVNPAQRKIRRKYAEQTVLRSSIDRLAVVAAKQAEEVDAHVQRELERELSARRQETSIRERLLRDIEPHIRSAAGQLHDYLDLSSLILKQLNVFLAREYPGIDVPGDLDAAPDELQSIYWAARLMEEKIAAFGFFLEPETITSTTGSFRLHGAVTKYRKIYQRSYEAKGVSFVVSGESFANVCGNREALTVIPHNLIDNAVKYAPPRSRVEVSFEETEDLVILRVASYGPRIEDPEVESIFEPFVRGRAASQSGAEGMGFGLAFADRVAREYGQRISVAQDPSRRQGDTFWTVFSCGFPREESQPQRRRRRRR